MPYTPVLTIFGIIIGVSFHYLGSLKPALEVISSMNPHLIQFIFLPALIMESAMNTDAHIFKKLFWQILILAGPAVLASMFITAVVFKWCLGLSYNVTFIEALVFGSIASATDPVAVVSLMKELGVNARLGTLIEGESLLNDGTAMVAFLVVYDVMLGEDKTFGEILITFVRLAFGGILLGMLCGWLLSRWLKRIHN